MSERDDRSCWSCLHFAPTPNDAVLRCTKQGWRYHNREANDVPHLCAKWAPRAAGDYRTLPRGCCGGKPCDF